MSVAFLPMTVEDWTDLEEDRRFENGSLVNVPFNGETHQWKWVAGDTTTENKIAGVAPGTVVASTQRGVNGRWLMQREGVINPGLWGAAGDATDESIALQKTADVAASLGRDIEFSGNYVGKFTLTDATNVKLMGIDGATLTHPVEGDTGRVTTSKVIHVVRGDGVTVEGLRLVGQTKHVSEGDNRYQAGLVFEDSVNCTAKRVRSSEFNLAFATTVGSQDCQFNDCHSVTAFTAFEVISGTGIVCDNCSATDTRWATARNPATEDVAAGYGFLAHADASDCVFRNCTSTRSGSDCYRVNSGGTRIKFESCKSISPRRNGVSMRGAIDCSAVDITVDNPNDATFWTGADGTYTEPTTQARFSLISSNSDGCTLSKVVGTSPLLLKSGVATFANAADVWTLTAHGLNDGERVTLTSAGTLPAGYAAATDYYVVASTANTFQLSETHGGTAVDGTDDGTGDHTFKTVPALADGISLQDCTDCEVSDCEGVGATTNSGLVFLGGVSTAKILDNTFTIQSLESSASSYPIEASGGGTGNVFERNTCVGGNDGILDTNSGSRIVANTVSDAVRYGINSIGANADVTHNHVISAASTFVNVTGSGSVTRYNSTQSSIGEETTSYVSYPRLTPEAEVTVSSASAMDIGSLLAASINISGADTIVSLGDAPVGTIRHITFLGALQFGNSTTDILNPGGGNITTEANDTAIVRSIGTNQWRCTHYTRAATAP